MDSPTIKQGGGISFICNSKPYTSKSVPILSILASKPHFKVKLKDREVISGQSVEFTVVVLGTPEPSLDWYLNDKYTSVDYSKVCTQRNEGEGKYVLTLFHVWNSTTVKCVAKNIKGQDGCQAVLEVKDKGKKNSFS